MAIIEFADIDKQLWIEALQTISCRSVQNFTSTDVAKILKISHKKFVDFEHGRIIDYKLLCAWAALVGYQINFNFSNI